ncbi:Os03g0718700 [Oryza sativa Japonica Group]|uniref:Os03g0718700 protein n=1 Tax=Oryza sativa subsp. japonica TaxID=39947 RepID=A0A0P0W2R0_ORYSJ|nr:Os03g0718700 [Oryza sativa Japonica Group]
MEMADRLTEEQIEQLKEVFTFFDKNNDFLCCCCVVSRERYRGEEQPMEAFQLFDEDGDGYISAAELSSEK